jgi:sugar phosphate isomerase/epimerase
MQIGICATPADIAPLPDLPFDFIEAHVQNLLLPEKPDSAFAPNAAATRGCARPTPAANCFLPADLKVTGPSVDSARLARYAEAAFARAASLNLRIFVFGSAGARQMPEGWSAVRGFEQYVEALQVVAPIAQRHGIQVVVEPLNRVECNLVNTIDEGAEAVRRCNHPSVQLLVDFFHMLRNGEAPDPIGRHAALVTHAHLAENVDRREPGFHGDDFRPFLRQLRKATRCQRLTIECVWSTSMPAGVAGAVAEVRRQVADAGY